MTSKQDGGPTAVRQPAAAEGWLPIESAPVECLVGYLAGERLYWAEAGHRGKGVMSKCWYTPNGRALGEPTHWAPLPAPPAAPGKPQDEPEGAAAERIGDERREERKWK